MSRAVRLRIEKITGSNAEGVWSITAAQLAALNRIRLLQALASVC
jgi:hypothetical protein